MANEVASLPTLPNTEAINALRHCGFEAETDTKGEMGTHWRFRFKEKIHEFETAKNRSRHNFHARLAVAKAESLAKLLDGFDSPGVPKGPASPADLGARVRGFVEKHGSRIGSEPFLHGLSTFMEQQRASPVVCSWRLMDDVLTESGGEVFMYDAIGILQDATFKPVAIKVSQGVDVPAGCHIWTPSWELSDYHVHAVMKALPTQFTAKPAGTVEDSSTQRNVEHVKCCGCICPL